MSTDTETVLMFLSSPNCMHYMSSVVDCVKHCSDVDDVVLSYMVGILEELGSCAAYEDLFDVEQFTEMMEAYLPGFHAVDRFAIINHVMID